MQAFLVSTGVVALAEIGDKTQLLALVLAVRFRRPLPIIIGILAATVVNHALAAALGLAVADWLRGEVFQWVLGISFIAMGAWALVPDTLSDDEKQRATGTNAFLVTLIAFFLVEIGDKTQVATMALAAQFENILWVAAGTTLGMAVANVPVVLLGEKAATRLPLKTIRMTAAALFAGMGLFILVRLGM
jgi:putative Ca2+/H+ antiporter (TMEM165/GDT1 family)